MNVALQVPRSQRPRPRRARNQTATLVLAPAPQAPAKAKPSRSMRRRARSARASRSDTSDYAKLLLSPPSLVVPTPGYPDGDPRPQIAMSQRRVYTMKPDSGGNIEFLLAPFYGGCIVMLSGITSELFSSVNGFSPTANSGLTLSDTNDGYGQLPISGNALASSYQAYNETFVSYRPLVAAVDCHYTGTSFEDSGSVTVSSVSNQLMPRGSIAITTPSGYTLDNYDGSSAGNVKSSSSMANSITLPARHPVRARVAPACPAYSSTTWINLQDVDQKPVGLFAPKAVTFPNGVPCSPYSICCPWKVIRYSGLANTASITVSVRYSAQYVVDDSSTYAAISAPSPAPAPATRSYIERLVAAIPTAEIANAASSAFSDAATHYVKEAVYGGARRAVRDYL